MSRCSSPFTVWGTARRLSRRVYIPKPGKQEKRPLGVPTVSDRALQRSTAEVLSAIYERDFLPCSFGGRPKLSAHHALATLNEVIAGGKISWVLEADLKNFFDHASCYPPQEPISVSNAIRSNSPSRSFRKPFRVPGSSGKQV